MNDMICYTYPEPLYFIFSSDTPALLYYSHLPATLAALLAGFLVLSANPKGRMNQLFFALCMSFSLWAIVNLILWTNTSVETLLSLWPILSIASVFISIFSVYFVYVYINRQSSAATLQALLLLLTAPVLIFAHTNLNISGFNITDCDAFGYEGDIFKIYHTIVAIISFFLVVGISVRGYLKSSGNAKAQREVLIIGLGTSLFLFTFLFTTYIASFLANYHILEDSRIEFYGLFGMIIFLIFISIAIVEFKAFRLNLISSQIIVAFLVLLTASQLTFSTTTAGNVLATVTVILTIIASTFLIRSVKREITQKEELAKLANKLEKANIRLRELDKQKSEFVSIASHQLRSPLAAIRGYVSMVLEGSFGKIDEKMSEPLNRVAESAKLMNESVEDFLSVSRIEGGNMKYELTDFNLRDLAENITDDLRPEGFKKGLLLLFKSELTSQGLVHADKGKTQQILHNLINNSLKYTPKGTVTIFVHDDVRQKKIIVDIIDTGIGMSNDTIHSLFEKFTRAKNANTVNIKGTGLGLFVAREMARAMGGDVVAHSDGEGHGSRFEFFLPVIL